MVPKEIEPHLGLSGLFSNQNYAGTWLSIIWPFSLCFIYLNKKNIYKKFLPYYAFNFYNNSGNNFDYLKKCIKWSIDFNSNNIWN